MKRELRTILQALQEGKTTERKQAVEDITRYFQNPLKAANLGTITQEDWKDVFGALSSAARQEHDGLRGASKGLDAKKRKIEDISVAVRIVVATSIPHLNNVAIEVLVPLLLDLLSQPGALANTTGQNYGRALQSIVAHGPHVRSFKVKTWKRLSRLAWAVLLNDSPSDVHTWTEEDPKVTGRASTPSAEATASTTQFIFASIIRHLCASPFAPFIERDAKSRADYSEEVDEETNWAMYLMVKFCRYFEMYRGAVASHVDLIPALCHFLEQVELNRILDMMWLSRRLWPTLVGIVRSIRSPVNQAQVVFIFKVLLPYLVLSPFDAGRADGLVVIDSNSFNPLTDLLLAFDQLSFGKNANECLSLDSLRLELSLPDETSRAAFSTTVFRHGPAFNVSQAYMWALLEVHSDCIFYLYRQEETTPHLRHDSGEPQTKRRRSENALEVLLHEIKTVTNIAQQLYRVQVLSFLISSHWEELDSTHRQLIISTIIRISNVDDSVSSFALLTLATIAAAPAVRQDVPPSTWTGMWASGYQALISNSPQLCRAGAHLLYTLLHANRVETSVALQHIAEFAQVFQTENEFFGQDAPMVSSANLVIRRSVSIPIISEATCAILSKFVTLADSDASLCRLHLEDASKRWLRESLYRLINMEQASVTTIRLGKGSREVDRTPRSSQQLDSCFNVQDLLRLLQAIGAVEARPTLRCEMPLPDDEFARMFAAYEEDHALRQFVINAVIPRLPLAKGNQVGSVDLEHNSSGSMGQELASAGGLEEHFAIEFTPSPRASKAITMLEEVLGEAISSVVQAQDSIPEGSQRRQRSTVLDKSRLLTKISTLALSFQACLEMSSTRTNTELYRQAFAALQLVAPWSTPSPTSGDWNAERWVVIIHELRPLVWIAPKESRESHLPKSLLLRPGPKCGLRRAKSNQLSKDPVALRRKQEDDSSQRLLVLVWQNKLANEFLEIASNAISVLLPAMVESWSPGTTESARVNSRDVEDTDFQDAQASLKEKPVSSAGLGDTFIPTAIALAVTKALKDSKVYWSIPWLDDLVADAQGETFLRLLQGYCLSIMSRVTPLNPNSACALLESTISKRKTWELWKSESMHLQTLQLLDVLSNQWIKDEGKLREVVRALIPKWIDKKIMSGGSWKSLVALPTLLDRFLVSNPYASWWGDEADERMDIDNDSAEEDTRTPLGLLAVLLVDGDIRVRSSAGEVFATIFRRLSGSEATTMNLYNEELSLKLPRNSNWLEGMLSRFIALSNVMIVSSPLRRGVYWHLIEVCTETPRYTPYLSSLTDAISRHLGFDSSRELFVAHAGQLARQASVSSIEFFQVPPRLLGFRTHKDCADASLASIVPMIFYSCRPSDFYKTSPVQDPSIIRYCKAIHRSPRDVIKECFAELVAGCIIIEDGIEAYNPNESHRLWTWILRCAQDCEPDTDPKEFLRRQADKILASILGYLSDYGFEPNGRIIDALREASLLDQECSQPTLRRLQRLSRDDVPTMHGVNGPSAPAITVLRAMQWFWSLQIPEEERDALYLPVCYHTTQRLFVAANSTPLLNEQARYMHSLIVWLCAFAGIMGDKTVIHLVLTSCMTLIQQEDLAPLSQVIMSWAFDEARAPAGSADELALAPVISRVAELGLHYSSASDEQTSALGMRMLEWIEREVQSLCKVEKFKEELRPVVTLWPRKVEAFSQSSLALGSLSHEHEVDILFRGKYPIGCFRAVRHLSSHERYTTHIFAAKHFWTLRDHIPDDDLLLPDDINAFMELLYHVSGQIQSIRSEVPPENTLCARQRERPAEDRIKGIIVEWLFDSLSISPPTSLHKIHETLRRLCHPDCGDSTTGIEDLLSPIRSGFLDAIRAPSSSISDIKKPSFRAMTTNYTSWVCEIGSFLANVIGQYDLFFAQLSPLLRWSSSFAAEMLPVLVHQALLLDTHGRMKKSVRGSLSTYFMQTIRGEESEVAVRQAILDVFLHLRHLDPGKSEPLAYDTWLEMDYLELAKTALSCGAYATAVLLLELVEEHKNPKVPADFGSTYEEALYEIYRHIDEPDGFYAIPGRDVKRHLMYKFNHEGKWDKAFQSHVSRYEIEHSRAVGNRYQHLSDVIQSLHSSGFNHLAMSLAGTAISDGASASSDLTYALAWRTESWDLPPSSNPSLRSAGLYAAMQAVHRGRDLEATHKICDRSIRQEMKILKRSNAENVSEMRKCIENLLCFREIKLWLQDWRQLHARLPDSTSEWFESFSRLAPDLEFDAAEALIGTRVSLIHSLRNTLSTEQIGGTESSSLADLVTLETLCLTSLAESARRSKKPQVAFNAVSQAQQIQTDDSFHVSREFAETLWIQGEHSTAIQFLEKLAARQFHETGLSASPNIRMDERRAWAIVHSQLGSWTTAARSLDPSDIQRRFFDPAVQLLDPQTQISRRSAKGVYLQYAEFANRHLRRMDEAEEYQRQQDWVIKVEAELQQLNQAYKNAQSSTEKDLFRRRRDKTLLLLREDQKTLEQHRKAATTFLEQAISMFAHYMEVSDDSDEEVAIKFCGLWFSRFDSEKSAEAIRHALQRISTYKLLFLAHQLTARLGIKWPTASEGKRNHKALNQLVEAMCTQHPFHSLLQVLTAKGVDNLPKVKGEEIPSEFTQNRAEEAKKIIENVRTTLGSGTGQQYKRPEGFMNMMEEALKGYVEWARWPIKDMGCKSRVWYNIPPNLAIYRWGSSKNGKPQIVLHIPPATADIPVSMNGDYSNIPTIKCYERSFTVAGGLHVPKINECIDTAGKRHRQLFKGEGDDDLRQDAVMEQVFQLINILLKQDRESKRRNLSLRNYKVIPLPGHGGLIQYVLNTEAMNSWLPKAHARYRPTDLPFTETLKLLRQISSKASLDERIRVFKHIRDNFLPVLRHFFTESTKQPMVWYSKRLAYTRSVATCSIGGHILGLGDRHMGNLLMDVHTGEMIHIDLGIAFDQGKLLPIPETVPFRLTADVVDGMGVAGTEGVFRRCCQETLRVLREGSETINTVLEVFKYDPLHSWTANRNKLRRVQDSFNEELEGFKKPEAVVQGAERAIKSVTKKLDGSLSVEYTVNELIVQARDPNNLSRIFAGWNPQC